MFKKTRLKRAEKRALAHEFVKAEYERAKEAGKRADIESFLLRKYGLKDIEKRSQFVLLHIAFFLCGVVSLLLLLNGKVNVLSIFGTIFTLALGTAIFRLVKTWGIPIENKTQNQKKEEL